MSSKFLHPIGLFSVSVCMFSMGVIAAVTATTLSNTESRANTIISAVENNSAQMNSSDKINYYKLVKLNIQSLVEVLNIVDQKLTQNIATLSVPTDTGIIDEITKPTNPIPPKTTNPTPVPAPSTPVVNNSCQIGSVTYSPGSTRCEGTTAMVCENKNWKATPNSSQCGGSAPTPINPPVVSTPPASNNNAGYLVSRQHAAEFCKIKFGNPAYTTINSNIQKSVEPNCTSRCLISKFNWVLGGSIIYEDREDYWGRDGWIVDNIKCTSDTAPASPSNPINTYIKNKTQKCVESERAYYWFDSNNQKTDLIKKCSTPPNGGLSCSESAGGCCAEGQVAINGQCITPANEGSACYATSGCQPGLSCNNNVCKPTKVVQYKWESNISSCSCDGKSEFGGVKTEVFSCKGDDGSTSFGSHCGEQKQPITTSCTMPTSCSYYDGLSISYPQSSLFEGEGMPISSAKINKCTGANNCVSIDIPKLDLDWKMDAILGDNRHPGSNMASVNGKLYGFIWSKEDNLGNSNMRTGDIMTQDVSDFFSGRRELIVSVSVKNPDKYPSRNPLRYEVPISIKNKFDAQLSKNQSLFSGYGVPMVYIELLGNDGFNEGGLYGLQGSCGATSSNSVVSPVIEFLDMNNGPVAATNNSLPGSRFKVRGLDNAPSGTTVKVLCTITETKSNTTRTITLSETK